MNQNEKHILTLCGIGHFYSHFYMLFFPSVALWIFKELDLDLPETLNLGFTMYLLFGLAALPMGIIGDRWSNKKMLILMLLGMGAGSAVCAMSVGPVSLATGLGVIGFFASIYHPVGIGLISKCCRNRGRSLGNNGVCGNLGIGLAPLVAGATAYTVGWRAGFGVFGAIAVFLGLLMSKVSIDETPVERTSEKKANGESEPNLLPYFVLMLSCMMLLGFCYRGTVVSIPAYFEQNIQSLTSGGSDGIQLKASQSFVTTLLVSMIYLFGIFGQITGGRLADAIDLRLAYLSFHILSLPCMVMMGLFTEIPLLAVSMIYIFFALGMQPIENSLVARLTPNHLRSLAYGLKFVFVLGMGSFSVKLVKWIMNNHTSNMVYFVQSGILVAVVVIVLLIYGLSRHISLRNG